MEFKGNELFETESGIYEYSGVTHDDRKVYGILIGTNNNEECFSFDDIVCVWRKIDTSESGLDLHNVRFSEARAEVCKATDTWRLCKSWKNDSRCLIDCPLHLQT